METIYIKESIESPSMSQLMHYEVVEHNGKKFALNIVFNSSTCLGFDTDCCIKIMADDGKWVNLVDDRQLNLKPKKDVYYCHTSEEKELEIKYVVQEFKDYITMVY